MPPAERASSTLEYPRLLVLAAALLLALRIGTGVAEALHPTPAVDLVHWTDASASLPAGKPILYDFSATWCHPCKKMQREVFADPKSAAFINETFATVRVEDTVDGPEARSLREKYRVDSLPTLMVIKPVGGPERLEGYSGKRSTLSFLRKAIAGKPGGESVK
jgi:thiol:disulfide interchange protein